MQIRDLAKTALAFGLFSRVLLLGVISCWAGTLVTSIRPIVPGGGRVDWGTNGIIAFDRLVDSYYKVFTMYPDGSNQVCLTCNSSALPPLHHGNPAWSPGNHWIAFEVEMPGGNDANASPGGGWDCNLWIMDAAAQHFYQITNIALHTGGVLHPHFSRDGKKLMWSQQYSQVISTTNPYGLWVLRVGDFSVINGIPQVTNIQSYYPTLSSKMFYESHGFGLNNNIIYFSAALLPNQNPLFLQIYSLDISAGPPGVNLTALTDPTQPVWNEHAQLSPDGTKIIYMSTQGNALPGWGSINPQSDYWIMNADGTNKQRLTFFNQPGSPQYTGYTVTCGDVSWNLSGKQAVGYIQVTGGQNSDNVLFLQF